ncbi:MAG: hypothetical protein KC416_06150, partial [Myxococcales bacterium]|nr:hypothetical protein [Myxococcales bacterium]
MMSHFGPLRFFSILFVLALAACSSSNPSSEDGGTGTDSSTTGIDGSSGDGSIGDGGGNRDGGSDGGGAINLCAGVDCSPLATECAVGMCNPATGLCVALPLGAGTGCGDTTDNECTKPDTCDGAGTCQDNHVAANTSCGDATTSGCTNPDTCDGAGTCQPNHFGSGTPCGDASDTDCDNPDQCDGLGTCAVQNENDGTSCNDCDDGAGKCSTCLGGACPNACGNDTVDANLGEQCDGSNDGACPGSCTDTCQCLVRSCYEILQVNPSANDGKYTIDADGSGPLDPFEVYCNMAEGGWTLIALNDNTTDFTVFPKKWSKYQDGFGGVKNGAIGWLGLDRIHALTELSETQLLVRTDVADHTYDNWHVAGAADKYRMTVNSSSPGANDGNWFYNGHNGYPFSTYDMDNDLWVNNCADQYKTGWWFRACYHMTIAGSDQGQVYWRTAAGAFEPATSIAMWVRSTSPGGL